MISGRNQLAGEIIALEYGDILAEISVRVGDNVITSIITKRSAENLNLKIGDHVSALIKSTDVMILKD